MTRKASWRCNNSRNFSRAASCCGLTEQGRLTRADNPLADVYHHKTGKPGSSALWPIDLLAIAAARLRLREVYGMVGPCGWQQGDGREAEMDPISSTLTLIIVLGSSAAADDLTKLVDNHAKCSNQASRWAGYSRLLRYKASRLCQKKEDAASHAGLSNPQGPATEGRGAHPRGAHPAAGTTGPDPMRVLRNEARVGRSPTCVAAIQAIGERTDLLSMTRSIWGSRRLG